MYAYFRQQVHVLVHTDVVATSNIPTHNYLTLLEHIILALPISIMLFFLAARAPTCKPSV